MYVCRSNRKCPPHSTSALCLEEKVLVYYLQRMSQNGFPLPVNFLRNLALVILRQRESTYQIPGTAGDDIRPPEKNWPQTFYERHPELKAVQREVLG